MAMKKYVAAALAVVLVAGSASAQIRPEGEEAAGAAGASAGAFQAWPFLLFAAMATGLIVAIESGEDNEAPVSP